MKKIAALLLLLTLCLPTALAESAFDTAALQQAENMTVFTPYGTFDTVVRPVNQPYIGQADMPVDGGLIAYVDYITLIDQNVTLLRLLVCIEAFEPITADQLRLTVGGKTYTFDVTHEQAEYDGLYLEDYAACLTDASLPLLKAIAQQKTDQPIPVELISLGEAAFSGQVIIPGEEAATLYDRYIDLGGKKQNLKALDEVWPCKIEKSK